MEITTTEIIAILLGFILAGVLGAMLGFLIVKYVMKK
jgi:ABC-type nitrate/sulfonate/bicarbonate transport system permease component